MTRIARFAAFACSLACVLAAAAPAPAIVPNPASIVRRDGEFRLTAATPIVATGNDAALRQVAVNLADLVRRTNGMQLQVRTGAARDGAINLVLDDSGSVGPEAYRLDVQSARIAIEAATPTGLFYGGVTLLQLIPPEARSRAAIPALHIADSPRFAWRGMMLDSARQYQSPEFIRRFIDAMALHKLNVLHWHLTDDQAWRLEIRKYPALTGIGAWRVPAGAARKDIDPATGKARLYGGFYSQKTVRGLVSYAAERGVTIVPEIEMPGHASAAIAVYPALGTVPLATPEVPADWGIYPNVLNLEEETFGFIEDVLTEVMELFPGKFIHKGGDEVQRKQWMESARVRARMAELGIANPAGLQPYFTNRVASFLEKHGRRLVGWDEILEEGIPTSAVIMSWRGIEGALAAARKGHDTVLAPDPALYFDNRQSSAPDEPPGRLRVLATLESVYRFQPMPEKLAADERKHVLGLQGNLWTEHIRTEPRVGWMAWPRAAAIAELGWSLEERRSWPDFLRRVSAGLPRYGALGLSHADSAFAVQSRVRFAPAGGTAQVELSNQTGYGEIRYTLDGSEPSARSPVYERPVTLAVPAEIRAATFDAGQRLSAPRTLPVRRESALRRTSQELKLCGNAIALAIEDDAPARGPRAAFAVDIQNPCWIFPDAELDRVTGVVASVGQLPFNFQIGDEVKKIRFPRPTTPEGELEVRLGNCEGELLARLPLAPAVKSDAVTVLPRAAVAPHPGRHDLCLRFAQQGVDPLWVLDTIQLDEARP